MTHWLVIGGERKTMKQELEQWKNLKQYINNYPESEVIIYLKSAGDIYSRVVKLKCKQNYQELDLDCNGGDKSIKHLDYRPSGIELCNWNVDEFIESLEKVTA